MTTFRDVLEGRAWRVLTEYSGKDEFHAKLVTAILSSIEAVCGSAVAIAARSKGLRNVHHMMAADDIRAVTADFARCQSGWVLGQFADVVRSLGLPDCAVIHATPTLRLVFPFKVARHAKLRFSSYLAGLSEPIQSPNPQAMADYHLDLPMAAWTHGPHVDSWWGQPFGGLNFWMAIEGVSEDSGLIFFEDLAYAGGLPNRGEPPYISAGLPLPVPSRPNMNDGDLLIFDPEILHATQVNISEFTRVTIAVRVNVLPLRFRSEVSRRHTSWRRLNGLDDPVSDIDEIIGPDMDVGPEARESGQDRPRSFSETSGVVALCDLPGEGERTIGTWNGRPVILVRQGQVLRAYFDRCPHADGCLSDIPVHDGQLTCSAHGMRFQVSDGAGICAGWNLEVIQTQEVEAGVRLVDL